MRSQAVQTISGRVDGASGTLVASSHPGTASRRLGAGDYRVRPPVGMRILGMNVTTVYGVGIIAFVDPPSVGEHVVTVTNMSGAGTDRSWQFVATTVAA